MENINRVETGQVFPYHNHDGVNSPKIPNKYVSPAFIFTPTQLTTYLAGGGNEGDSFTVFDGTNYYLYVRINKLWKRSTLS